MIASLLLRTRAEQEMEILAPRDLNGVIASWSFCVRIHLERKLPIFAKTKKCVAPSQENT